MIYCVWENAFIRTKDTEYRLLNGYYRNMSLCCLLATVAVVILKEYVRSKFITDKYILDQESVSQSLHKYLKLVG